MSQESAVPIRPLPWQTIVIIALITAAGLMAFLPARNIPYYSDAFQDLHLRGFAEPNYFLEHNPRVPWYRPVGSYVNLLAQMCCGRDTTLIHAINFAAHFSLAVLVFLFMLPRCGSRAATLGFAYMLLAQANASAIMRNDTTTQVLGTLFGCAALWSAYSGINDTLRLRTSLLLSAALFSVAVVSKETSVTYLIAVPILGLAARGATPDWRRRTVPMCGVFAAAAALYLLLRFSAGYGMPFVGPRYGLAPAIDVLRNGALLAAAAAMPFSSVTVYQAWATGNTAVWFPALLAATAIGALVFLAWVRKGQTREAGTCLLLAAIALLPALVVSHTSELYVYNAMPFLAVLFGGGVGALAESWRRRIVPQLLLLAALTLLFASHCTALREKALQMQKTGGRAAALLDQIGAELRSAPFGASVFLVNPPPREPEYSVFVMNGFNVFTYEESILKEATGRDDLSFHVVEGGRTRRSPGACEIMVTLSAEDRIRVSAPHTCFSAAEKQPSAPPANQSRTRPAP